MRHLKRGSNFGNVSPRPSQEPTEINAALTTDRKRLHVIQPSPRAGTVAVVSISRMAGQKKPVKLAAKKRSSRRPMSPDEQCEYDIEPHSPKSSLFSKMHLARMEGDGADAQDDTRQGQVDSPKSSVLRKVVVAEKSDRRKAVEDHGRLHDSDANSLVLSSDVRSVSKYSDSRRKPRELAGDATKYGLDVNPAEYDYLKLAEGLNMDINVTNIRINHPPPETNGSLESARHMDSTSPLRLRSSAKHSSTHTVEKPIERGESPLLTTPGRSQETSALTM